MHESPHALLLPEQCLQQTPEPPPPPLPVEFDSHMDSVADSIQVIPLPQSWASTQTGEPPSSAKQRATSVSLFAQASPLRGVQASPTLGGGMHATSSNVASTNTERPRCRTHNLAAGGTRLCG